MLPDHDISSDCSLLLCVTVFIFVRFMSQVLRNLNWLRWYVFCCYQLYFVDKKSLDDWNRSNKYQKSERLKSSEFHTMTCSCIVLCDNLSAPENLQSQMNSIKYFSMTLWMANNQHWTDQPGLHATGRIGVDWIILEHYFNCQIKKNLYRKGDHFQATSNAISDNLIQIVPNWLDIPFTGTVD